MWSSGRSVIVREGIEKEGTRIQSRPYVMDVDMTVVVQLADGAPVTAEEILKALDLPARTPRGRAHELPALVPDCRRDS